MNLPSSQSVSAMNQLISSTSPLERIDSKTSRINHPTVNSLMNLYGSWILDCCLLQIKDRCTRSSLNDGR